MTPEQLRKIRTRTGLSREKFGNLIHVGGQTVGRWERDADDKESRAIEPIKAEGIVAAVNREYDLRLKAVDYV